VAAEDLGKRFYLFFDGVFRDSRIYLNDYFVGGHASGYTSFWFDVTDLVEYGGENVLVVRADAMRPEGWFYEGGGLYRHVWLVETDAVHVAPWGTFVTAEVEFNGRVPRATVQIRTTLANRIERKLAGRLVTRLLDPRGQPAGEVTSDVSLEAGIDAEVSQTIVVDAPALWSVEEPNLYTVVSGVEVEGRVVDEYRTTTGLRRLRFDKNGGFFLNEKPVKLKGVCCHQDHAGVGAALPDHLQEFRLRRLKEMGCNAYRCSHNPATPELLDAADRLGILVMAENRLLSSADHSRQDLEAMIRRDRNHPCIVLWSLGNEEFFTQWLASSVRVTRTLRDAVHRWDPTRPVTLAVCFWNPATNKSEPLERHPVPAPELDVMGFNYFGEVWDAYHAKYADQPATVSEASTPNQTRGCYETDDARGQLGWLDPRSNWTTAEDHWQRVATQPYLSGIFLWTGFDYRGEPSPHGWPAISSHFGIMDTCGFPKDSYYYYRAMWRDEPLVHVLPHWNWPDKVGQPIRVACYTNCQEVELFVNGVSQGRKAVAFATHAEWPDVIYAPGVVEAKGYREGKVVATARVETTGPAHGVRLTADRTRIAAGKRDGCVVDVAVVDGEGRVVPEADQEIVFHVEGAGDVLGVGNGDPASHEPDKASHRRAFHGLCQVILRSGKEAGRLVLTAQGAGLVSSRLAVEVVG
jgi:beta-galactosidase